MILRNDYYKTEDYVSFMRKILNLDKEWFILDKCFENIRQAVEQKKK